MKPTISLAFRDGRNEPCPQSWKMIKSRTRKPAARTANGAASHQESIRLRWIKYQSAAYGTSEFTNCQMPRHTAGFWYFATMSLHAGRRDSRSDSGIVFSTIQVLRVFGRERPI